MRNNINKTVARNAVALKTSGKTLADIYRITFDYGDKVMCEYTESFRIKKLTYRDMQTKIENAADGLYQAVGANHKYIALAIDNSADWIVAFWAILKSGNKPYLVNLRYPDSLTNGILRTLNITHTLCTSETSYDTQNILLSSLPQGVAVPEEEFENEIAFSSSATSMNEVVCFYTGYQICEQILNFEDIVKTNPRIIAQYHGQLKHLAFLPFYHVFGLFAVYFWFSFFGCSFVFLRDYSADTILRTCRKHQVTHIFAVPVLWHTIETSILSAAKQQGEKKYEKLMKGIRLSTKLQNAFPKLGLNVSRLLMHEVTDKVFGSSIMFCISGGSYIKDSTLALLNGIGYHAANGYGMSEVGITSVELSRKPKKCNLNSIGKPFSSVEYRLDEDGILWIKGTSLCVKKLINGKEQILDGWFNTGDRMECRDGSYYIQGRLGDVVIGENGENINPDSIEKMISIPGVKLLSVLGLSGDNGQELSIVIQVSPYVSEDKLNKIRQEVYALNDTLPKATAIKKFYFTTDELCPPTAIKVSRTQLIKKIQSGQIKLTAFADMQAAEGVGEDSPLADTVKQIVAEVLGCDAASISSTAHLFYDLGATSIQYFSILSRLSQGFSMQNYQSSEKYCYTVKDLCEYISKGM